MSESTPGATSIMADVPLPRTAPEAAEMYQTLRGNPEYMKGWETDQGKQSTLAYLRWTSQGYDPEAWGRAPATPDEVRAQMGDRDQVLDERRVEGYGKDIIGFNDGIRATIKRGLATPEQHAEAERQLARMIADPEFGRKIMNGDMDARDKWARWNLIKALRVAPADFDWSKSADY
jgi:hypothetical protein